MDIVNTYDYFSRTYIILYVLLTSKPLNDAVFELSDYTNR